MTIEENARPCTLVVMGPAGAGKSTIGEAVAKRLGAPFYEGDAFHPPENVAKIRSGEGLNADDRRPWIAAIGTAISNDAPSFSVLACSALNGEIRELLHAALPGDVRFVLLDVPEAELLRRLEAREGHFAGPSLLRSQLDAMDAAEDVARVDGQLSVDELVDAVVRFVP
ncbi:MAG: gluconokinase, GntK/IdnK-type [Pseudomonadota bacterium]